LVKKGDRQVIHLTSDLAISDPFLTLLVELNAAGNRTLRQYVLLLDPPAIAEPPVAVNAPETLVPSSRVPEGKAGDTETKAEPGAKEKGKTRASAALKDPTSAPEKSGTHVVKRGETLAGIAAAHREEGVSVDQMLLALQRTNPQAFIGNNIDRLKAGSLLRMPESETVRAIDPTQAREFIRAQRAEFQRYREQLVRQSTQSRNAALPPQSVNESSQRGVRSTSGSVTLPAQEMPSSSVPQDKLKLTAPAPDKLPESGQAAAAALKDSRGTGAKEGKASTRKQSADTLDQIASDKALADANSRIAALEKNIRDMQQLADIQDQAVAEKQAAATAVAEPLLPFNVPVPSPAEPLPTSTSTPTTEQRPAPTSTPAPAPAPAPEQTPASASFTQQIEDVLQDLRKDPPVIAAGIAGLLLLLSWVGLRYRRRPKAPAEKTIESEGVQSVFDQAGGRNIDTSNSVFHSNFVPSVSQLDTNEVDAVAEADVYIAYGRDEQAEEILQDALRLHPDRHALRVKLLEIYASRKDRQKFGTLAAELRVLTHGVGEAWTQAAKMGVVIDPGNLLYGAALREEAMRRNDPASLNVSANAAVAQPAKENSPVADFEFSLEGLLGEQRNDPRPVMNSAIRSATAAGLTSTGKGADKSNGITSNISNNISSENTSSDSSRLLEFSLSDSMTSAFPSSPVTMAGLKNASVKEKSADIATLQTKLDLAIACDEIGDKEGARELLAEVAGGPDPALAQRAQSLLSQLA
jgi:pilus assembly protein FimV